MVTNKKQDRSSNEFAATCAIAALGVLLSIGATTPLPASAQAAPATSVPGANADANDVLFWSQKRRDAAFRAMESVVPTRVAAAGGTVRPLTQGAPLVFDEALSKAIGNDIDAFMARQRTVGVIILKDGQVRFERYAGGFGPNDRWTSFSVAKSITATLVGAAVRDGAIASLDDKVVRYIPALAGSAYDDVTVRHLLTMSSGVKWNESYANPRSDVARFMTLTPQPGVDVAVEYMRRLPREAPPGTCWRYNTGETTLTGLLVATATKKPLAQYLSEKIWRPYGMERDAIWALDRNGREIGGCCLSASLRDYARFGQFMLDGGVLDKGRAQERVLPDDWVREATKMQFTIDPRGLGYGYQWWTYRYGGYEAKGIFGQSIYIDPVRRIVVVTLGNWPNAGGRGGYERRQTLFLYEVQKLYERQKVQAGLATTTK